MGAAGDCGPAHPGLWNGSDCLSGSGRLQEKYSSSMSSFLNRHRPAARCLGQPNYGPAGQRLVSSDLLGSAAAAGRATRQGRGRSGGFCGGGHWGLSFGVRGSPSASRRARIKRPRGWRRPGRRLTAGPRRGDGGQGEVAVREPVRRLKRAWGPSVAIVEGAGGAC
jgi:hypothetical protein